MDNWNNFNPNPNPIAMGMQPPPQPQPLWRAPHYEIIQVNGEAGAQNFKMAPNSTALLLDKTGPIVWLAQTDGTGYLTVTPYDITLHQAAPQVDVQDLAARVAQIEEIIKNAESKSNSVSARQSKKQNRTNPSAITATAPDSAD